MPSTLRWLREAEERYEILVDSCPYGIGVHVDGRVVYMNPAGAAMLGCSKPADVVDKDVMSFVHPDYVDLIDQRIRQVREARRVLAPLEQRLLRLDGESFDAEVAAMPVCYLGRDANLVVFRDITEQRRKDQALRDSDAKFRALFEASLDTIAINRLSDGRYIDVNEEFLRVTGYERDDVIGKTPADLILWVREEDLRAVLAAIRERGFIRNLEAEFRRKDGSSLPALFSAAVTEIGGERCIVSIARDITDRKQMETELVEARDEALAGSRLKSAFLANMSHEVRTPLNVITGFCSLVAESVAEKGDEDLRALADTVERASRRLIATVQGTLDLAALESGTFGADPQVLDLTDIVGTTVRSFEIPAALKGVDLTFETRESSARLFFDEYCLTQAVNHLVDNAVKFTERGSIRVIIFRDVLRRFCLVVRDTGVGIAPDFLQTTFAPFSQEESGYTRRFEGAGLGLALAHRFLESHDASLAIRSTKGIGTTVTVRFPTERER